MIPRIGVEGYIYGEMFGSELTGANQKEGDGKGAGLGRETGGGGQGPFWLSGTAVRENILQFPPHRGGSILISNFRRG